MFSKLFFSALLFWAVVYQTTNGQNISQFESAANKSNAYMEKAMKAKFIPGVVAGVSINGTQVWANAFGLTDIENNVKTRVDSVWRMGSVSKAMTSVLIGQLMDEGLVDMEKSINEYLKPNVFPVKQWNNKNVTITVGQVMSHTAGLRIMKWPQDLYINLSLANVTEQVKQFKDDPLIFEPGTQFKYSNYGFQIMGAIAEAVLNDTYENAINKLFRSMGMNSTSCERRETIIAHRARYYINENSNTDKPKIINTVIADDLTNLEANWPSGGIISTVPDMLKMGVHLTKWYKGVNDSKTYNMRQNTVKQLWTPIVKTTGHTVPNTVEHYAHGWYITTLEKPLVTPKIKTPIKDIIWHTGGMAGSNTIIVIEPINEVVLTIFTNLPADEKLIEMTWVLFNNFIE